jgi:DMSO/TMAO reductase YedYZ heme-binding membrane subunit
VNDKMWWYATRSAGIVAWILLALSVLWGLALSTKAFGRRPRPNWLLDLHRFLGGLAVVFTAVHVITILFDTFVSFSVVNVLVPFTGTWHPNAVAWGIVSMYALVAVEITSLLRRRLSRQAWRAVHYLSFPLFATATVHVLTTGTDRHTLALRALLTVAVVVVIALTMIRFSKAEHHDLLTSPQIPSRSVPLDGRDRRESRS